METAEWITLGGIIVGALVTVGIALWQRRNQVKDAAAADRVGGDDDERNLARLAPSYEPDFSTSGMRMFTITNLGHAPARDVSFELEPVGEGIVPPFSPPSVPSVVDVIEPGMPFRWRAIFMWTGLADQVRVTLRWTDTEERVDVRTLSTLV